MRDPRDIIIRPIFTEKAVRMKDAENKYVFEVAKDANKPEIKKAIETLFKVHVEKVAVVNYKGKSRRLRRAIGKTKSFKKAIVTLKKGERIPIFEGVG
jgi:large subunit ribosomal protein L23